MEIPQSAKVYYQRRFMERFLDACGNLQPTIVVAIDPMLDRIVSDAGTRAGEEYRKFYATGRDFIEIHPLDLGAILWDDENPTDIILHKDAPGSEYPSEYIEYRGKFYRQTVNAPVTSEYGKKILKRMEEDNA